MQIPVPIVCPKCGHEFSVPMADTYPGAVLTCDACLTKIKWTGDDGRKAQKAWDDHLKLFDKD